MILIKPKKSTLFSLGIFIVICLATAGYAGYKILSGNHEWYYYVLVMLLGPLGAGILLRQLLAYKYVRVGKSKIEVHYPARFSHYSQKLNEINFWKETRIKTTTGQYKEAVILFANGRKLSLSYQEHAGYESLIKYLNKKVRKLRHDD